MYLFRAGISQALTSHISRPAPGAFSMKQQRHRGVRLHVLVRLSWVRTRLIDSDLFCIIG